MTRDGALVEDVARDAFVRAFERIGSCDAGGRVFRALGPLGPGAAGSDKMFWGTHGGDRIDRGGDDTIRTLAGNDTVFDTGGRNVACGGDGND